MHEPIRKVAYALAAALGVVVLGGTVAGGIALASENGARQHPAVTQSGSDDDNGRFAGATKTDDDVADDTDEDGSSDESEAGATHDGSDDRDSHDDEHADDGHPDDGHSDDD